MAGERGLGREAGGARQAGLSMEEGLEQAGQEGGLGRPRARANLSPAWRHFSRIGDRRTCLGCCLHCGAEVSGSAWVFRGIIMEKKL